MAAGDAAGERRKKPTDRGYVIATDMGGTFVDAVLIDEAGRVSYGKAPVTPSAPGQGLFAAIAAAAGVSELRAGELVAKCERFVHGTTVTTNAMIERSGGPTGLLITQGFEDTLPIGRVLANTVGLDEASLMDRQHAGVPFPVVPVNLTRGISERVDHRGRVLCAIDEEQVAQAIAELVEAGVRSLAVCLLFSFQNPRHERWIRDYVRKHYPAIHVTISSDLIPAIGEYERANTTAVNAYLQPVFDKYVANLDDQLVASRAGAKFLVMQSIGGVAPASEVRSVPVTTLYSGPVGGVIAARQLGQLIGEPNLLTTDMGGTSFDVGLIVDGQPEVGSKSVLQRNLLLVPAVQVATVGAGGGSVVWLDDAKALRVGPKSQGSVPGPACYGRGGTEPTVTDADVVLGYINPDAFLGGKFVLSREEAVRALEKKVAQPLGMSVTEAAAAVYTIVNAHMADLIRQVSIRRGFDPRGFALVAFGGGGPTHVTGYGPEIGVRRIIVPLHAPVFSALGIGASDLRHFYAGSVRLRLGRERMPTAEELAPIQQVFDELVSRAREQMARDKIDWRDVELEPTVDMHYEGQVNELTVPVVLDAFKASAGMVSLLDAFRMRYEQRYGRGSSSDMAAHEITMARVNVVIRNKRGIGSQAPTHNTVVAPAIGTRDVYWPAERRYTATSIYRGEALVPGQRLAGPAVIEMYATSVPLHPGQKLEVDAWHNLIITQ